MCVWKLSIINFNSRLTIIYTGDLYIVYGNLVGFHCFFFDRIGTIELVIVVCASWLRTVNVYNSCFSTYLLSSISCYAHVLFLKAWNNRKCFSRWRPVEMPRRIRAVPATDLQCIRGWMVSEWRRVHAMFGQRWVFERDWGLQVRAGVMSWGRELLFWNSEETLAHCLVTECFLFQVKWAQSAKTAANAHVLMDSLVIGARRESESAALSNATMAECAQRGLEDTSQFFLRLKKVFPIKFLLCQYFFHLIFFKCP